MEICRSCKPIYRRIHRNIPIQRRCTRACRCSSLKPTKRDDSPRRRGKNSWRGPARGGWCARGASKRSSAAATTATPNLGGKPSWPETNRNACTLFDQSHASTDARVRRMLALDSYDGPFNP